MKVLQGELQETRYEWPKHIIRNGGMTKKSQMRLSVNEVGYINDELGLHQIENTSRSRTAVSLHVYVPPFDTCQMFDPTTGRPSRCNITFWSSFGRKNNIVGMNEFESSA